MMKRINLNELAKMITWREGKKKSLSIGQIKEVLRITLEELGYLARIEHNGSELILQACREAARKAKLI